jgi:hypothetical protein
MLANERKKIKKKRNGEVGGDGWRKKKTQWRTTNKRLFIRGGKPPKHGPSASGA